MNKNYEAEGLTPERREAALAALKRYREPNPAWDAVSPEAADAAHVAYLLAHKEGLNPAKRTQAIRDAMFAPLNTHLLEARLHEASLYEAREEVTKDLRAWAIPALAMAVVGWALYAATGRATWALTVPAAMFVLTAGLLAAPLVAPSRAVRIPAFLQVATGGSISFGSFLSSIALYTFFAYVLFQNWGPAKNEAELARLHEQVLRVVELTAAANETHIGPEQMEQIAKTRTRLPVDAVKEANSLVATINVQRRSLPITVKPASPPALGKAPTAYLVENETRSPVTYVVGEVVGPDPQKKDLNSVVVTFDTEPTRMETVTLPEGTSPPPAGTRFLAVEKEGAKTLLQFRPYGGTVESFKKFGAKPAVLNDGFDPARIERAKLTTKQ